MRYTYDEGKDRVKSYWLQMPNSTGRDYFTSFYSYGTDAANRDRVVGLYSEWGSSPSTATGYTNDITYTYDSFGRMTARKLNTVTPFTTTYDYWNTSQLRELRNGGNTWYYDYDVDGNINTVMYNGRYSRLYDYDSAGQLIREFDYDANTLILYTYDNRGNILTKKTYPNMDVTSTPVTDTYLYNYTNCRDTLLNYNGTSINYDAIGNPSNWRDGLTFGWINGRQLGTVKKNNTTVGTYTYDSTGMRIKKTAGGVTTTYHVMNGVCYGETRSDGKNLQYVFDENGRVIGFRVQESGGSNRYYFVFNAQGDVVQLLHASGRVYANYTYDTWGRCTVTSGTGGTLSSSTAVGNINPFRYRGYYYDTETGLYYLQSRYYDPVVGRFVNADGQLNPQDGTVGYNMFAYCNNNPVVYSDPDGHSITLACVIVCAVVGGLAGGHFAAKASKAKTGKVNGWAVASGIAGGGFVGGFVGWGVGTAITAIGAIATGTAGGAVAPAVEKVTDKVSQAVSSPAASNAVQTGKNIYYQVTSKQAIEQMRNSLQLKPLESTYNYVMQYQPTFAQAKNLGCRSMETVVRFSTNFSSFVPDTSCSVPGALVSNVPGVIDIMDVVEVGFK